MRCYGDLLVFPLIVGVVPNEVTAKRHKRQDHVMTWPHRALACGWRVETGAHDMLTNQELLTTQHLERRGQRP